jgi:flagellum-specific peptidoglycan hydrolase FlgJ
MQSVKVLKLLPIIGLVIILLLMLQKKSAMGLKNKAILLVSKYRALMPYVVAQAKLETANFTSKVYKVDNNMFGMKVGSSKLPGLMSPEGDYYRHYNNDTESLIALLEWFEYKKFPVTVGSAAEYAQGLKDRNYYGAPVALYQKNLELWLSKA